MSDAAIRRFGLGYAPEDFGGLLHYLRRRGFREDELEHSGLIKRSAKGNLYDIFRHRGDGAHHRCAGVPSSRSAAVCWTIPSPSTSTAPETLVYHKSRTLFALNVAKKSTSKRYILCEGYMDVISMHEAGFDTAVCACGTALTPEQVKLLSEYADEVILSYDSDEAGQKATERSLGLFANSPVKVSVLSYQGAKDPDEFIKKYGRERFDMLLNGTANPTEFQLKKAKAKYDLRSDDGRLSYIREAIDILTGQSVTPTARDGLCGGAWRMKPGCPNRQFSPSCRGLCGQPTGAVTAGNRKKWPRRGLRRISASPTPRAVTRPWEQPAPAASWWRRCCRIPMRCPM